MNRPKQYVDGVLVEWGSRLFYPPNRVQGRYRSKSGADRIMAGALARRASPDAVRSQIRATLKQTPQVMVKVTGGGRGMGHIAAHFRYISRKGELTLENERGEQFEGKEALKELRDDWKLGGTEIPEISPRREAFNVMLSMPRTVDSEDVRAAAREFARREFGNHQYAFALHRPGDDEKTERPHVHLVVRAEGFDGRRLNPRKADLQRWREGFAQALNERGVDALATRRHSRGETQRSYSLWEAHTTRTRPLREVSHHELERQKGTLKAWREMAMALAESEDPADRDIAIEMTQFVAKMPATRLVAANADRLQQAQRDLVERQRAAIGGGRDR